VPDGTRGAQGRISAAPVDLVIYENDQRHLDDQAGHRRRRPKPTPSPKEAAVLKLEEIVLAHEPDIAWLIALWLAIHGGDSLSQELTDVDETSVLLAAALSSHLADRHSRGAVTLDGVSERLAAAGIQMRGGAAAQPQFEAAVAQGGRRLCITLPGGRTYCFVVPTVKGPPPGEPGR
jgi:hypothetical protein